MPDYEALVVGGAAAGISAALVLGRARVRTLVVDAGEPSNRVAHAIGGLLGQGGTAPGELYAAGRAQLAELPSVELRTQTVTEIDADLRVTLGDGATVSAARVLLAGGMDYRLPGIHGLAALWGDQAFMCPYCHGWEWRDKRIGLLGEEGHEHRVPLLGAWTDDLVVFDGPVAAVAPGRATLVDGTEVAVDAFHVVATPTPRDDLAAGLGLATSASGAIEADRWGATSIAGVFAAGDATGVSNVAASIGQGSLAGTGLRRSLVFE